MPRPHRLSGCSDQKSQLHFAFARRKSSASRIAKSISELRRFNANWAFLSAKYSAV